MPPKKSRKPRRSCSISPSRGATDTRRAAERFREVADTIVVLGADGERELEVVDETVEFRAVDDGPQLVSLEAVFEEATRTELLEHM